MEDRNHLSLRYHGGEADQGEMGYYEAAAAIMAFGDLMGIISQSTCGQKAFIRTTVQGVREGSFSIDFIMHFGGIAASLISGPSSPKEIWELLKLSLEAWKFLKGKPPQDIARKEEGFMLTNISGEVNYVNQYVYNIITDDRAGAAVEEAIRKPLESGRKKLSLENKSYNDAVEVVGEEASSYTDVTPEEFVMEQTVEMGLTVESAVFKEGNKWRFFDGEISFSATIEDEAFINQIDEGERFGKGDVLFVKLHIVQLKRKGQLKTERAVKKVIKHQASERQLDFVE